MLRFRYQMKPRKLRGSEGPGSGPQGRINTMRKVVTKLFRYERYEGRMDYCDEARGYAELLIQRAISHGDTHRETMRLADHWLLEKDLIHKLFKVFVPRYQAYTTHMTNVWTLPSTYPGPAFPHGIIELKGNPWPPVLPKERDTKNLLSNILLGQAKMEYHAQKQYRLRKSQTEVDAASSDHELNETLTEGIAESDTCVGDKTSQRAHDT